MTSIIMILRISTGHLPSLFVALYGFFWQVSLVICIGILNCLSFIHLSIAHQWAWVHEWQARSIHQLCALVSVLHLAGVVGADLHRGVKFQVDSSMTGLTDLCQV